MARLVALAVLALAACNKPAAPGPDKGSAKPVTASPELPLRFAVVGDFGANSADEAAVANLIKAWRPAFVITTGDNNYPNGAQETIDVNIGKFYAEFIGHYPGQYGKGSDVNRFWPSLGNHDWRAAGVKPYLDYFTLPGNKRYYDVDLGIVHLYALDSDRHEPDGTSADSIQAKWLQDRLAQSKSCFDIVYFHHPPYSSGSHGPSEYMRWPFRAWGAEAVLAGHDHTYERFEIDGIPYFVNGLGGASYYPFTSSPGAISLQRYNEGFGAQLVTASLTGINFMFMTTDGVRRDNVDVAEQCKPRQ